MRFVILIASNPESRAVWESMDPVAQADGIAVYARLVAELRASGELVETERLAEPSAGVLVGATDGPFAEAKEFLAGFFIVDCSGMERAVEIASRIPEAAKHGLVEVRPVLTMRGDTE